MMWLIRRHGFVPNHAGLDNRSQTPYFALMVDEYLALHEQATAGRRNDELEKAYSFSEEAARHARCEYFFWRQARAQLP